MKYKVYSGPPESLEKDIGKEALKGTFDTHEEALSFARTLRGNENYWHAIHVHDNEDYPTN